ncbi:helix-turn-helix transcriptional regulator [Streptomyces sp. NPDC018045]|uniref:helix-turn-helix transcriptional regulator n=1 Tax=Streptomyces sp. NPDC018045 TaxID=3365037 RepID=UPI0037965B7D
MTGDLLICARCFDGFRRHLKSLPALYRQCENMLAAAPQEGQKVSGTRSFGIKLNAVAVEARDTLRARLLAWCDLVAAERVPDPADGGAPPERTVEAMTSFLLRHAAWLCGHPAAGDVVTEIAETAATATRAAYPQQTRRFRVGPCVEVSCGGSLVAVIRADEQLLPSEVRCDVDTQHVWPAHQWRELERQVTRQSQSGLRWLTAKEVSQLWRLSISNVYRLASENSWRRRTSGRRVYYFKADVLASVG